MGAELGQRRQPGQEEGDAAGSQTGRKAGSAGDPESGQESVLLRGGSGQVPGNQGALREEPRTDDRARERKRQPAYNGRSRLVELVEQIHGIEGLERIRLGSLEPRIVTPEAVRRLAAPPPARSPRAEERIPVRIPPLRRSRPATRPPRSRFRRS